MNVMKLLGAMQTSEIIIIMIVNKTSLINTHNCIRNFRHCDRNINANIVPVDMTVCERFFSFISISFAHCFIHLESESY